MDHVDFNLYQAGKLIHTKTFKCGKGQVCPEPTWEWNDTNWDQYTRAHFAFDVPNDIPADLDYDLHILGQEKKQEKAEGEEDVEDDPKPIWELESKFHIK